MSSSKKETDWPRSKLGPIPPEHLENDAPFREVTDKGKGSLYDKLMQHINDVKPKAPKTEG